MIYISHALKRRDKSVRQYIACVASVSVWFYIEIITARSATSWIQAVYRAGLPVIILFFFLYRKVVRF